MHLVQPTDTAPLRSHRPGEQLDHYLRRLKTARLRKDERAEIDAIYATLDAEWLAEGYLTPPERAPWTAVDILEFRDLSPRNKYLDLKGYARICDRYASRKPQPHPEQLAA